MTHHAGSSQFDVGTDVFADFPRRICDGSKYAAGKQAVLDLKVKTGKVQGKTAKPHMSD